MTNSGLEVLMKQAGLRIQENRIFLNIGNEMTLAMAATNCSSSLKFPTPQVIAVLIGVACQYEEKNILIFDPGGKLNKP